MVRTRLKSVLKCVFAVSSCVFGLQLLSYTPSLTKIEHSTYTEPSDMTVELPPSETNNVLIPTTTTTTATTTAMTTSSSTTKTTTASMTTTMTTMTTTKEPAKAKTSSAAGATTPSTKEPGTTRFHKPQFKINFKHQEDIRIPLIPFRRNCSAGYLHQLDTPWRVVHNVLGTPSAAADDVILVTHLDGSRLSMLLHVMDTWKGAISAAIYVTKYTYKHVVQAIVETKRHNVKVTLLLHKGRYYPSNVLRNLAVQASAPAEFLFLVDVDFVPMNHSEKVLRRHALNLEPNQTFVVPAFEYRTLTPDLKALQGKEALATFGRRSEYNLPRNASIVPFHYSFWKSGHLPTNYYVWWRAKKPYKVTYRFHYEPYVLMRRSDIPAFQGMLLGRSRNKESFFYHLDRMNYTYIVLPDVYVIHWPHKTETSQYSRCSHIIWKQFKRKLDAQYPK